MNLWESQGVAGPAVVAAETGATVVIDGVPAAEGDVVEDDPAAGGMTVIDPPPVADGEEVVDGASGAAGAIVADGTTVIDLSSAKSWVDA